MTNPVAPLSICDASLAGYPGRAPSRPMRAIRACSMASPPRPPAFAGS